MCEKHTNRTGCSRSCRSIAHKDAHISPLDSYRYFHGDGYGKDFRILNLREETTEDKTETLLLGNLLSFYEQQRVLNQEDVALRPYKLEKPLWVFVGSSVNAVYTENKQKRSDVLTVARLPLPVAIHKASFARSRSENFGSFGSSAGFSALRFSKSMTSYP